MARNNAAVEITVYLRENVGKSIAVWDGVRYRKDQAELWAFLPLKYVEDQLPDPIDRNAVVTLEIPEWLALDRGLI